MLTAGRTVDLGETVKDSVELIGRDADAAVNDGEPNARGFRPGIRHGSSHGHMPLLRKLERIADEIQQNLMQPNGIAFETWRHIRVEMKREGETFLFCPVAIRAEWCGR